jgi:hypothetical protein
VYTEAEQPDHSVSLRWHRAGFRCYWRWKSCRWVVLSARFKPRERSIFFLEYEMLNLRPNEMTSDARQDLQEPAIGDDGYAFNLSMMIGDEFEMRYKRAEAFPPGKRLGTDHHADKLSVRRDERIDLFRELLKILFFEWVTDSDEKNAPVSQQFKFDHGSISLDVFRCIRAGWPAAASRRRNCTCRLRARIADVDPAQSLQWPFSDRGRQRLI